MTRLLLVEDHVLVRQSIRAFLEGADLKVIGEASTGTEAVELALALQPDLVIIDVHLPEMNGIEATRHIHQQCPQIHIIALTAYNEKAYQRALSEAGAEGFVLKTAEFSELMEVIKAVIRSEAKPCPTTNTAEDTAHKFTLTEREYEVLLCTARGWTNKEIGVHLKISDRTVQVHLKAIYHKLDVVNRTEAVLRAIALGIVHPIDGVTK